MATQDATVRRKRRAVPTLQLPIALDPRAGVPMTAQLVAALRSAVLDGLLAPGARLPSSRVLADELAVSRTVTTEAYARLVGEGYLEPRRGSGTYVCQLDAASRRVVRRQPARRATRGEGSVVLPTMAFRTGATYGETAGPTGAAMALRQAARLSPPNHYISTQGELQLRTAIAAYVARSRGLSLDPDDIVVTTGTTQSTDLVLRCLTRRGDAVAIEDPAHPSLPRLLTSHGTRIVTMPVDDDGALVRALPVGIDRPRLVHVTPSHQFPLGVRMTVARRLELIEWAAANEGCILEDDYDSEYRYDGPPLPTLAALDPARVIYMGTMSKVLSPAVRCGYLAAPRELVSAIVQMKDMTDGALGWPVQQLVLHLLDSGNLERHVRRTRLRYARVRNTLRQALASVSDVVTISGIEAGLHVVLQPREVLSVARVGELAGEQGLALSTLADFYVGPTSRQGLLLGYGGLGEEQVEAAGAVLVAAIRQTHDESRRG